MNDRRRGLAARSGVALFSIVAASLIAGCASQPQPRAMVAPKPKSKEYFAEKEYGVKASPRVTNKRSRLPRGGGRDQIGKPYQIKGQWYYPKEQPGYSKSGKASWYGDAFHGRLTANGEVYDMTHLSAAHPTMPLPSYARVTNLKNGSSVLVRVNDRGPYAHGRVIDLSKRAAEMLDYTHSGIADVRIDYVGRAPLEGADDEYLLASYQPGNGASDPSDGLATGVMIAMAGPTPTVAANGSPVAAATAFPGTLTNSGTLPAPAEPVAVAAVPADGVVTIDMAGAHPSTGAVELPDRGPLIVRRPANPDTTRVALAPLSYADIRVSRAAGALATFADGQISSNSASGTVSSYIAAGTFSDLAAAENLGKTLASHGVTEIETAYVGNVAWYSVTLRSDGRQSEDALLKRAWAEGASDAFIVRN
jgi:rare lipoprotein A